MEQPVSPSVRLLAYRRRKSKVLTAESLASQLLSEEPRSGCGDQEAKDEERFQALSGQLVALREHVGLELEMVQRKLDRLAELAEQSAHSQPPLRRSCSDLPRPSAPGVEDLRSFRGRPRHWWPPPEAPPEEPTVQLFSGAGKVDSVSRRERALPRAGASEGPVSSKKSRRPSLVSTNSMIRRLPGYSSEYSSGFTKLSGALSRVRHRSALSKKVWAFLDNPDTVVGGSLCMRLLSFFLLLNATLPVLQTVDPQPFDPKVIQCIGIAFDIIFDIEVCLRFWSCPNRLAFCLDYSTIIDISAGLLAVFLWSAKSINYYDSNGDRGMVALFCMVPVLRFLKLLRRFDTFHLIMKAFRLASEALPVMIFILTIIVLVFASILYVVEPRINIPSMPISLWFTIVTVGTVGYGDITPHSSEGTIVVSVLIIVSALYMAIPLGIVGQAFATVWDDRHRLIVVHRMRALFMGSGYSAHDVPDLFCSFDKDADGLLSVQEFADMMEAVQLNYSGEKLTRLFCAFDIDNSNSINDQEFVRALFPEAYAKIYAALAEVPEVAVAEGPVAFRLGKIAEHQDVGHFTSYAADADPSLKEAPEARGAASSPGAGSTAATELPTSTRSERSEPLQEEQPGLRGATDPGLDWADAGDFDGPLNLVVA